LKSFQKKRYFYGNQLLKSRYKGNQEILIMKQFLLSLFVVLSMIGVGQSQDTVDQRVIDIYGSDYVEKSKSTNSQLIDFLTFKLDHSYRLVDMSGKLEGNNYPMLSEVKYREKVKGSTEESALTDYNNNALNVLAYAFQTKKDERRFYRIDGTTNCLMFYSNDELIEEYNKSKIK